MKLYDFMKVAQNDFDTEDTIYCATITVCYIDEEDEAEDNYYRFCTNLIKKVEVEKQVNEYALLVKWTDLIKNNMEKFKKFSAENWHTQYEEEDEFIYQWIKEIHYYLAGYVDEDFYGNLVKFVETLEA